ncbi:hypothetical protein SCOR_22325 [Sulfidibacter corallicola]
MQALFQDFLMSNLFFPRPASSPTPAQSALRPFFEQATKSTPPPKYCCSVRDPYHIFVSGMFYLNIGTPLSHLNLTRFATTSFTRLVSTGETNASRTTRSGLKSIAISRFALSGRDPFVAVPATGPGPETLPGPLGPLAIRPRRFDFRTCAGVEDRPNMWGVQKSHWRTICMGY